MILFFVAFDNKKSFSVWRKYASYYGGHYNNLEEITVAVVSRLDSQIALLD